MTLKRSRYFLVLLHTRAGSSRYFLPSAEITHPGQVPQGEGGHVSVIISRLTSFSDLRSKFPDGGTQKRSPPAGLKASAISELKTGQPKTEKLRA